MRRHSAEQGFILITALWLLLLSAAVVSFAMVRNSKQARVAGDKAKQIQAQLDADAAVETIAADLVIRGPTSSWAELPAHQALSINGKALDVSLSSESGRLDLNSADLTVVDRALQGLGADASERATFKRLIETKRGQARNFTNLAEPSTAFQLLSSLSCPTQFFTVYSGLTQLDESQLSASMARAIGTPKQKAASPATAQGAAMRLRVRHPAGAQLEAVVRFVGSDRPYEVMEWNRHPDC